MHIINPRYNIIVAVPIFAVEVGDIGHGQVRAQQDNSGDVSEVCQQCRDNGATVKIDIQNIFGAVLFILCSTRLRLIRLVCSKCMLQS